MLWKIRRSFQQMYSGNSLPKWIEIRWNKSSFDIKTSYWQRFYSTTENDCLIISTITNFTKSFERLLYIKLSKCLEGFWRVLEHKTQITAHWNLIKIMVLNLIDSIIYNVLVEKLSANEPDLSAIVLWKTYLTNVQDHTRFKNTVNYWRKYHRAQL